jgi:threonine dehydrogenase-like Zn-dependent dehydrogenase
LLVKAAVQVADRVIDVRSIEVADDIEPGWAVLRIEASGICGSDHEIYSGAFASMGRISYPLVAGHEPVGRIEKIGKLAAQRWNVAAGDLVAVEPFCPCGVCARCV